MLERVPLLEKQIDDYAEIVGHDVIERVKKAAVPLRGMKVLHVNATAYGGGVAELLATHVPLLRSVGIEAEWHVLNGSDEFFHVTKAAHNGLQGAAVTISDRMQRTYLERVLDNARNLHGDWDVIVGHDPQTAALANFCRGMVSSPGASWVWRCHIDLTDADDDVWEFFRPFVESYDASVWTMREFVPKRFDMKRIVIAPPCIDPLSVKNLDLPRPFAEELCKQYGVDARRPLVCQISRFDPWKDPSGVIRAFHKVRAQIPDAQLLLAGSMATDDPEGFRVWEEVEALRAGDRDIHLLSNLHQVGNVQVNAFQRQADVVVQKSIREGFGLTVSEALWKGRPVVGGRAGGITMQIRDGHDGYLVDNVEECAARVISLLAEPATADGMGACGREHVRTEFLATRELEDWLRILSELGMR